MSDIDPSIKEPTPGGVHSNMRFRDDLESTDSVEPYTRAPEVLAADAHAAGEVAVDITTETEDVPEDDTTTGTVHTNMGRPKRTLEMHTRDRNIDPDQPSPYSWNEFAANPDNPPRLMEELARYSRGIGDDTVVTDEDRILPTPDSVRSKSEEVESAWLRQRAAAQEASNRIEGRDIAPTAEESFARLTDSSLGALVKKHGEFKNVLSGEVAEMMLRYSLKPKIRGAHRYDTSKHGMIPKENGLSFPIETGANVAKLIEENPDGRFKFYLSLNLETPEQQAQAQEFIAKVWEQAAEQGIAMLTKTESHSYDSCDIYTWNPEEMAAIIAGLHDQYPDIWLESEHPLQGQIAGVEPMHVGFVQEPIMGLDGDAHSARMAHVGEFLDEALASGAELTPGLFAAACKAIGVKPEAPWLIDRRPTFKR